MIRLLMKQCCDHRYADCLIVGDFNYRGIDWEHGIATDSDAAIFNSAVNDCFLNQHQRSPTRHRKGQISSLLDLVFTQEPDEITSIQQFSGLGNSDHDVLFIQTIYTADVFSLQQEKYLFNRGTYQVLRQQLRKDWGLS